MQPAEPTHAGAPHAPREPPLVPLREALPVWTNVALNSFGGPAGQIAVMHRVLVEERRWISEARFLHALNYCMLLPGPEAQQLATYVGWLLHRTPGALLAGTLFVLPGFVAILALSFVYARFGDVGLVAGLFAGVQPAVLAIVAQAVVRLGRRVLRARVDAVVAVAAFVAIFVFEVPFPWIVLGGAVAGALAHRAGARDVGGAHPGGARVAGGAAHGLGAPEHGAVAPAAGVPQGAGVPDDAAPAHATIAARLDAHAPAHTRPSVRRALRTAATCLGLWFAPLLAIAAFAGADSPLLRIGTFFSRAAIVTFGGAYAVLAYVAQQAVEVHGWLQPGEMLDGLGMAETTPGPLIMVVQFVGFMGAWRHPDGLDPWVAATLGALLATWVTFVPCFLWILVGAPWIEALRGSRALAAALRGLTAAVVGVLVNLAVWFALHALFADVGERHAGPLRWFAPSLATLRISALVIAVLALLATFRFRLGMLPVLGGAALLGMAWSLLG